VNFALVVDRVVQHGPVNFQSFTFTPRLCHRMIDLRHICLSNLSIDSNQIPFYIETISTPYQQKHFDYYFNDQKTIIVEYNEDIGMNNKSNLNRSKQNFV